MKPLLCLLLLLWTAPVFPAPPTAVSSGAQPGGSAGGDSFNPTFSADGQHLVFVSHANNLVTNDDLGLWLDVFVRGLVSSNTVLVSVSTNGFGGANADANYPSISSNGRFVAFASRASNLTPGDTNGAIDVFVRDVNAGTTRLVSTDLNGNAPPDPTPSSNIPLSGNPLISADGRWVFFESRATNLITGGAPFGSVNIYARDTWSNLTVVVTRDPFGNALSGLTVLGGVTPDARYVAFTTTNLAVLQAHTNAGPDIYVRDMLPPGFTRWASTNASAPFAGAGCACTYPVLTASGDTLAYLATANGTTLPMAYDFQTGVRTTLYPSSISNLPPAISADGNLIAFEFSQAGMTQILLANRASNTVTTVHQKLLGNYLNNRTVVEALSAAGRFVFYREFGSDSPYFTNFIPRYHLFRKDLQTTAIDLISAATNGGTGVGSFEFAALAISPDASRVAFDSSANDLAPSDLNGASDIFLRDVNAGLTELITEAQPTKRAATSFAHSFLGLNSVSADGRFIVSTRYDDPSAYRDTNGFVDVFVSDAITGASVAASINQTVYFTNSGGGSGDTVSVIVNTNSFTSPVISADGSTIYATRGYTAGPTRVFGVWTSNALNGTGMGLASRGINVGENGSSYAPSVSSNGQFLVFTTTSSDMVSGVTDNNLAADIILRRTIPLSNGLFSASNELISLSTDNFSSGNGASIVPMMSSDASFLAFATKAGNLLSPVAGGSAGTYANYQIIAANIGFHRNDTNYLAVIPKRLCSYTISFQQYEWLDSLNTNIHRTNLNTFLNPVGVDTTNAVFSANNRYVIYSLADGSAIWRHDLLGQATNYTFVSYAPFPNHYGSIVATNILPAVPNVLVCSNGRTPSVSADGNVVAYERVRDGTGLVDLFAKDLLTGAETLVSGNLSGALANDSSTSPFISGDGRYVVFQSKASDLVANDTNGLSDIFVRDRLLGVTMLVSASAQGRSGNGASARPVLAADGRTVAFQSFASDLAGGDFNDKRDVFLLKLGGADSDGDGMNDDWEMAYFNTLARDGSGDCDNDGVSDLAEFRVGTDPTNSNSVFRVLTVAPAGGGSALLLWTGNPARSYRAEFKDDLCATNWTALSGTISWNGSTASIPDPNSGTATNRYYRVQRLP